MASRTFGRRHTASLPLAKQYILLRIFAASAVLLLMLSVTFISVQTLMRAAAMTPSTNHISGIITSVEQDRSFTLRTEGGSLLHFSCGSSCHASLLHMERHIQEQAKTDVFYQVRLQQLQAFYVD